MKALVTGGGGFIGSHLVDALLARGAQVLVIDDFSTGREQNLKAASQSGRLELERCSITSSEAAESLKRFSPEVVFHLAAQMNVRRSVSDPVFDATVNVVGTVNLLEACRQVGVKKFIFASTGGAIYGEQEVFPAPEEHESKPEAPYGVSKKAGEGYLEYFSRAYPLVAVALRYANVYGPRQNPHGEAGVVAIFAERLRAGEPLRVNGDGKQTRDFVYVGDVVEANLRVLDRWEEKGLSVFNVGRGKEVSLLQLIDELRPIWEKLASELGCDGTFRVVHGPALPGEQRRSVVAPDQLALKLQFHAEVSLAEGLTKTIRSFVC